MRLALNAKHRAMSEQSYAPAAIRLSHNLSGAQLYFQIDNLFDSRYQEITGVAMPGRTLIAGVSWGRPFE